MKVAHFLLKPELAGSPPNEAIINALTELGCDIDLYAPGGDINLSMYDMPIKVFPVEYGKRWMLKNIFLPRWQKYDLFSGTTEDPMAIVGMLSTIHRKRSVTLGDEIRSGSYAGNKTVRWKKLCQRGMRNSAFRIVNDRHRVDLLKDYLNMPDDKDIIVYPGCFRHPPVAQNRKTMKSKWGFDNDKLIIGDSGLFYYEHSALWLIEALASRDDFNLVIQPLNTDPLSRYLLTKIKGAERIYMEPKRIEWLDAWSQMGAVDIGVAIYRQTGPQFQNMGVSSNRLCMFLAMGVPVIVSKQPSFEFIEKYDCGIMVENEQEFIKAIDYIKPRLEQMKLNALKCTAEYIDTGSAYGALVDKFRDSLGLLS